jgi:hypothetical protein
MPFVGVASASTGYYYAGYSFCGNACSTFTGVLGDIYVINPTVASGSHLGQYGNIYFSYSPLYWVQVGYAKGSSPPPAGNLASDTFYCEYNNGAEHFNTFTQPTPGQTVVVELEYQGSDNWLCEGATPQFSYTETTTFSGGVDISAFSEMTNTCISIGGTHFSFLQLFKPGFKDWEVWNQHASHVDSPYSLTQVSNYEFTASGGTGC